MFCVSVLISSTALVTAVVNAATAAFRSSCSPAVSKTFLRPGRCLVLRQAARERPAPDDETGSPGRGIGALCMCDFGRWASLTTPRKCATRGDGSAGAQIQPRNLLPLKKE